MHESSFVHEPGFVCEPGFVHEPGFRAKPPAAGAGVAAVCLAVPMQLVSVAGHDGQAEVDGVGRRVRLDLVPEAKPGDYVIVHAGFAIEVLDERAARETLDLLARAFGGGK